MGGVIVCEGGGRGSSSLLRLRVRCEVQRRIVGSNVLTLFHYFFFFPSLSASLCGRDIRWRLSYVVYSLIQSHGASNLSELYVYCGAAW